MKKLEVEKRRVYVLVTNTIGLVEVLSVHTTRDAARAARKRQILNWTSYKTDEPVKQECFIDEAMLYDSFQNPVRSIASRELKSKN